MDTLRGLATTVAVEALDLLARPVFRLIHWQPPKK